MAVDLRSYTPARVALGRTGHSLPTRELLRFQPAADDTTITGFTLSGFRYTNLG